MTNWLRIGGWALVAIVALYIVFQIVSIVFSIISWIVGMLISLAVVGVLLFLGYLLVKRLLGGAGSGGRTGRERERIYE